MNTKLNAYFQEVLIKKYLYFKDNFKIVTDPQTANANRYPRKIPLEQLSFIDLMENSNWEVVNYTNGEKAVYRRDISNSPSFFTSRNTK